MAAIEVDTDRLTLNVATPRFTDLIIADSTFGATTSDVHARVIPWSDADVDRYYRQMRKWRLVCQHVVSVVRWRLGREIRGGLVGAAFKFADAPLTEPHDRAKRIENVMVLDSDPALLVGGS